MKLYFPLAIALLLLFNTSNSFSQVIRCYTVQNDSILKANDPNLQSEQQFEQWLSTKIEEKKQLAQQGLIIDGVYQIPVVVHVIHNGEAVGSGSNVSYAAIQSQIDVLNEDFRRQFGSNGWNTHADGADTKIEFCLAKRRPDGSAFPNGEDGVNRINRSTAGFSAPPYTTTYINSTIKTYTYNNNNPTATRGWDPGKYMNIWLCNISGGILGYAQFPTSPIGGQSCNSQSDATDGVVFLYNSIGKSSVTGFPAPYNEGRTATHEIGHWLGLRHIWGDGNCSLDDYCNDTPNAGAANYGCPNGTNSCTTAAPDYPDMIENYMDYTNDLCMNIFTNDQKMRMRTVLENSPIRVSLITSDACVPPAVSDASIVNIINPTGDNCPGPITPTVVLRNRGTSNLTSATIQYTIDGGTPVSYNWTGNIAPAAQANVTLPSFTSTLGTHLFSAVSSLPNGVVDPHTEFDASEITFAVSNGYQPNYTQDFDGGQFPPDVRWSVDNTNGDCYQWIGGVATSSTGVFNNACALMPNYGNASTSNEYLYTPYFILPCGATSAQLSFDVAYRKRATANNDRLRVEFSTDCGSTWQATPIYDKAGTTLQTVATALNGYWIPSAASDWRNEVINLTSYIGSSSSSVQFRFRGNSSGNGGNLYVDNVKFTAVQPTEINVSVNGVDVLDEGAYDFGAQTIGSPVTQTFTVSNTGTSNLTLTPPITITGSSTFTLGSSFGTTTIPAGGSTTFTVTFTPTGAGPFTANLSFVNNDCDEGTYNFQLTGSGSVTPPTADFSADVTTVCQGSTITFTDASTAASSWSWTFNGGTPSTATTVGPHTITYSTPGTYSVTLTVSNAYGNDTETKTNYITVLAGTGQTLPISEGFVGATFPPTGWSITNGGAANTWVRSNNRGTAPTAGNSAYINYFSTNTTGDVDDLNTPPVDLNGYSSATLTFDVAYALYNASYPDKLEVVVSSDCGQSFTTVYSKAGATLATDPNQTTAYTNPSTWRNEIVDLTPYVGNSKVEIKFRGTSAYGQYIYIDNVNITGVQNTADADFTISTTTACTGETVTFTDNSTGATSWSWNFGTGATPATATGVGPHTVTYASSGTKNITLSINGGADSEVKNITINSTPTAPTVSAVDNCGSSTLSAVGTGLLWSTGETTSSINVTTAGSYTVTQTVGGCTSSPASVTASPTAIPAAPTTNVVDNCGSSTLSAVGTGLLWSTGETTSSINVTTAGSYTVTQTISGCTSSPASVTASPTEIPAAPTTNVVDNCGSSTLSAVGTGLLWSTGETTASINVTTAGSYTVTQTISGCTSSPASVTASPTEIPAAPTTNVVDNCGSSTLSAVGTGLLWSTGETTPSITVYSSGTYTVTQTVGGCTSSPASVTANPTAIPAAPTTNVVDNCGSSTLSAVGTGLTWSTGETTASINVTTAGSYTVTQTVGGCTSSPASVTANPTAGPAAPTVSVVDNCGSSTLSAVGTGLLWSTGETTPSITVYSSGTYTVTQTISGCTSSPASVTASPTAIPAAPTTNVVDNCGSSTLSAVGTGLLWSTGETTPSITVYSSGTYTVTQTISGCTSSPASVTASPTPGPAAPTVSVVDNCGSSTLSAVGTGLLWSTGETTPSITVYSSGTYTVTQTISGCTSSPASVTANPTAGPAAPTVSVVDNCGSSTLSAVGTGLLWSTGETTASITVYSSGTYTVTQTISGCTSSPASVTANPTAGPAAPTVSVVDNCGSSTLSAVGTGLTWSTGETTPSITVYSSGTYTVTQTISGCTSSPASVTANPTPGPAAPMVSVVDSCGYSILTAIGSNLSWSTGETTPTITVTTSGNFWVSQTIGGCTSATTLVTASPYNFTPTSIGSLPTICSYNDPLVLTSGSPAGGTYVGNGVTNGTFYPSVAGLGGSVITYEYTNANGCKTSAQALIIVDACLAIDAIEYKFDIYPNPTSDELTIYSSELITKVQIIDPTGKIVYEESNLNQNEVLFNFSDYSQGIYQILTITDRDVRLDKIQVRK
ncbi:MAG: choice-of-anchor D domain-containing protein [Crocinitomicaceae bacterium]|nr:choice-of-anchor D domain-containing protein [Crocinitomicaceae bacterium]